jgi:hypothetical protein
MARTKRRVTSSNGEVPTLERVTALRTAARPRVKSIKEVYSEGKIIGVFLDTDMEARLLARQRRLTTDALLQLESKKYKVPRNVQVFLKQGFVWNQIAVEKPWAVYVLIGGRRKRKRFNNLREAILFHKKICKEHPSSGIVSLCHSYELPRAYLVKKDKLPRKFKWCPQCAAFRVFRIHPSGEKIYAMVKVWNDTRQRYEYTDRQVWLTECQLCGGTNRNTTYRRANQPYEVRRIKKGVRRVKPRGDTTEIRAARVRTQKRRRG